MLDNFGAVKTEMIYCRFDRSKVFILYYKMFVNVRKMYSQKSNTIHCYMHIVYSIETNLIREVKKVTIPAFHAQNFCLKSSVFEFFSQLVMIVV